MEITINDLKRNWSKSHKLNLSEMTIEGSMELMRLLKPHQSEFINPISYETVKKYRESDINAVMCILGLYTLPTIELIEWLRYQIEDDPEYYPDAIEICAGTGCIGRSLGIPITDSCLQDKPNIKELYHKSGQYTIEYPSDIIKMDAHEAVKEYQPEYIIGSYVTARYGTGGKDYGNMYGVDNMWIANNCHKYFYIGNLLTHAKEPVLKRKHKELSFPWLVTRGDSSKARIFIFENKQWRR